MGQTDTHDPKANVSFRPVGLDPDKDDPISYDFSARFDFVMAWTLQGYWNFEEKRSDE
jgi:hypothetical protein